MRFSRVGPLLTIATLFAVCVLATACESDKTQSDSDANLDPVAFSITAIPATAFAVEGQAFVLLVTTVNDPAEATAGPVTLTASSPGQTPRVEHAHILPGEVAEITVIPADTTPFDVTVVADRLGRTSEAVVHLSPTAASGVSTVAATAAEELERILGFLETQHSELGITAATEWQGSMPEPVDVVEHYLYFSDAWELHIMWHVTIPPHDWTRYELRRRFEETAYSQGFMVSSRSADPAVQPEPLPPENTLWR